MFELSLEARFSAAHALTMGLSREPLHGHDFHVTLIVAGETLDDDGLLCDFHTIKEALAGAVAPFNNTNLNETPPFNRLNPTAELVARHIALTLEPMMPPEVKIVSVRLTESPGCAATYRP